MSINRQLWENRDELLQAFHIATIHGILSTWRRCESLGTAPQEPDFVAGLLLESTPLIHSALRSAVESRRLSVSMCSVFCHQTPQVTFGSSPSASCELGDVLFAYVHTPRDGATKRNALLFQAKVSAKQPYPVQRAEEDQLRLYLDWPEFIYRRSSFLNGQDRSVTPKAPHAGAQYLLIDDRPPSDPKAGLLGFPGTYPVGCCMPDELLLDHSHLAAELFNLFIFRTGRPFEDKRTAQMKKDWSHVVWDLIESGVRKAFNRKNSRRRQKGRSIGDAVEMLDGVSFARTSSLSSCSTASEILGRQRARALFEGGDNLPPDDLPPDEVGDTPEGGAVSLVLIETSERPSEE